MYMFGSANFNVASSMREYSQQILLHLSKEQVKAFVKGQRHKRAMVPFLSTEKIYMLS